MWLMFDDFLKEVKSILNTLTIYVLNNAKDVKLLPQWLVTKWAFELQSIKKNVMMNFQRLVVMLWLVSA